MNSLLELPIETLVVLGAGYLAYRTAFDGLKDKHKALDATFLTLVFGLIAKLILETLPDQIYEWAQITIAVSVTVACSALWRKFGALYWGKILRRSHVSYSDGMATAWQKIRTNTDTLTTQIMVHTMDGTILRCDDLGLFNDEPFGPCVYGEDGSIALYVTSQKSADGEERESSPKSEHGFWGSQVTHISADQIKRINVRSRPR